MWDSDGQAWAKRILQKRIDRIFAWLAGKSRVFSQYAEDNAFGTKFYACEPSGDLEKN